MGCSFQDFILNPQGTSISCMGGFFSWATGGISGAINWLGDQIKLGVKGFTDAIKPYWVYIVGAGAAILALMIWRYGAFGTLSKVVGTVV